MLIIILLLDSGKTFDPIYFVYLFHIGAKNISFVQEVLSVLIK